MQGKNGFPEAFSMQTGERNVSVVHHRAGAGEISLELPRHVVGLSLGKPHRVDFRVDGRQESWTAQAGDVQIIPAHAPHRARWDDAEFVMVLVEPALVASLGRELWSSSSVTLPPHLQAHDPLMRQLVLTLNAELGAEHPDSLYVDSLTRTLGFHLVREYARRGGPSEPQSELPGYRLRRVTEYIRAHLREDITLADLAEVANLSEYHFARLFKAATGTPPYQYVIAERMKEGRRLLRETNWPIAQVALAVGYESQSRFTTLFKRHAGTTPGRYQDQHP